MSHMSVEEVFSELLADNWEIINLEAGNGDGDLSHSYGLIGDYSPEDFEEGYQGEVQYGESEHGKFEILNVQKNRVDINASFSIEDNYKALR